MADESKQGMGGAIALVAVVVAVVTLGFNTVVFLVNQQGKLEDKQDYLAEKKADKSEVNRKAGDRYTATMASMEKQCSSEKERLHAAHNKAQFDALRWESKADDCENRWLLHLKVCKCSEHSK